MKDVIKEICEDIKQPIESFDIREMITHTSPPFEWCNKNHPINQIGQFFFGISDGFKFDREKIAVADEVLLWKLYALIQTFWCVHYREWHRKQTNMVFNMRNNIIIKVEDAEKDMLSIYEKHFDWR